MAKEKKEEKKKEEEEARRLFEKQNNTDLKPSVGEIDSKEKIKPVQEMPEAKGSIVFNKIDVADESVKDRPHKDRPKVALDKLEKTQRLISKLKEKGETHIPYFDHYLYQMLIRNCWKLILRCLIFEKVVFYYFKY